MAKAAAPREDSLAIHDTSEHQRLNAGEDMLGQP